jgi:hypothetical protein
VNAPTWRELLERISILCVYRYRHSPFRRWQRRRFARRRSHSVLVKRGEAIVEGLYRPGAPDFPRGILPGERFEFVSGKGWIDHITGLQFVGPNTAGECDALNQRLWLAQRETNPYNKPPTGLRS